MERRLGRGLGTLLGDPLAGRDLLEIDIEHIRPNPHQPRRTFDPAGLEELRQSIQEHGVLQPVVLRRALAGGGYELVSGERRWRAARLAGLGTIPATLRGEVTDQEMLELALVENLQRQDLDPIERARGFKALMESSGMTQEGVSAKVGLRRSTVANHVRLLDLPDQAQDAVANSLVTMGHARALLGLPEQGAILQLLEATVREDLSVRELERRVREASQTSPRRQRETFTPKAKADRSGLPAWAVELERRLRESLGTKVVLQPTRNESGRIVIEYFNRADLDRVCEKLTPRTMV